MAEQSCCCHFPSNKPGNLFILSEISIGTLKSFCAEWSTITKEPERSLSCSSSISEAVAGLSVIHRHCYARISSKQKLDGAKRSELVII